MKQDGVRKKNGSTLTKTNFFFVWGVDLRQLPSRTDYNASSQGFEARSERNQKVVSSAGASGVWFGGGLL